MSYKWKPSASARRAFAERMKDPDEQAAYNDRKSARADKRRAGSKFDYNTAGGHYIPTAFQHQTAFKMLSSADLTTEQVLAANQVAYGFSCQEKIHHDYIHLVNEWARTNSNL